MAAPVGAAPPIDLFILEPIVSPSLLQAPCSPIVPGFGKECEVSQALDCGNTSTTIEVHVHNDMSIVVILCNVDEEP